MRPLDHVKFMGQALELAHKAALMDEVPVGAVVVHEGEIIAEAFNNRETSQNPTGHAELIAIQTASEKLGRWRLSGCTLYVTLEPCLMCAGAVVLSRMDRVVYGTHDPKAGAVTSIYQTLSDKRLNHRPEVVTGIEEGACSKLLKDFFSKKRT